MATVEDVNIMLKEISVQANKTCDLDPVNKGYLNDWEYDKDEIREP